MPRQALRRPADPAARSRDSLLEEVRRLQARAERQDLALSHAAEAIVTLRRGLDALRAHNRELQLEAEQLRAARTRAGRSGAGPG